MAVRMPASARREQLLDATKKIVAEHAGAFPEAFAEVRALPGIGRYTAGAILSIGQDQRLPAPLQPAIAASTSRRLTAQTSH